MVFFFFLASLGKVLALFSGLFVVWYFCCLMVLLLLLLRFIRSAVEAAAFIALFAPNQANDLHNMQLWMWCTSRSSNSIHRSSNYMPCMCTVHCSCGSENGWAHFDMFCCAAICNCIWASSEVRQNIVARASTFSQFKSCFVFCFAFILLFCTAHEVQKWRQKRNSGINEEKSKMWYTCTCTERKAERCSTRKRGI